MKPLTDDNPGVPTQNEQVLMRLVRGPLTPGEALNELGVARLAARIYDLRHAPWNKHIISKPLTVPTRNGASRISQYFLMGEDTNDSIRQHANVPDLVLYP